MPLPAFHIPRASGKQPGNQCPPQLPLQHPVFTSSQLGLIGRGMRGGTT
ncbi:hypothetical protein THAOC_21431, partial [Thalassiosira oceanica]